MIEQTEPAQTVPAQTHILDEIGDRSDIHDENKEYHEVLKAHFLPVFNAINRIKIAVDATHDIGTRLSECQFSDIICCSGLLNSFSLFSQSNVNADTVPQEIEMVPLSYDYRNGI